mgnify:FL=1
MPTLYQWALGALAVYWLTVLWRRWSTHARTERFVLEQRRKAGIPDSDRRPFAEAAADVRRRRQEELAAQLKRTEDVFRVHSPRASAAHLTNSARRRRAESASVEYSLPALSPSTIPGYAREPRVVPVPEPSPAGAEHSRPKRAFDEGDAQSAKRHRSERPSVLRKRQAEAIDEEPGDGADEAGVSVQVPRRVRRRLSDVSSDEDEDTDMGTDEDEEIEDEDMDDSDVLPEGWNEEMSMEEDADAAEPIRPAPAASAGKKRRADTTADHAPGDEWEDANGLRWRIGDDRVPRRAVMVVEMRPKYRMPRDAEHPDARVRVPVYTEKFLSQEEYEEAKRKKTLSWQYERARAQQTAQEYASDDNVEDSLASLVHRRSHAASQRRPLGSDLLYSDTSRHTPRSRAGSLGPERSFATQSSMSGDDSGSFSSSIGGLASRSHGSLPRRLRLVGSPGPGTASRASSPLAGPERFSRYGRIFGGAPSALSPARVALDADAKRRREEQLLAPIRAERSKRMSDVPAPAPSPAAAPAKAPGTSTGDASLGTGSGAQGSQ